MMSGEQFVKDILKRGRYSFTIEEAAEKLNKRGPSLVLALQRLKQAGWVAPFSRGFYLALDVQHQDGRMMDPAWFIDDWAKHMRAEYYVGGLSAAALHGATHQQSMQFQVFLSRQIRPVKKGWIQLATFYKNPIPQKWIERRKSPAGYYQASVPEMTAYDCIAYPRCCPSLDHAATVIVKLGEAIHAERLAELPSAGCSMAALQRLGWLLERVGWSERSEKLHKVLRAMKLNWAPLESRLPRSGERNDRWRIIENTDVQPDIER